MSTKLQELTMPKWGLTMEEGTLVKWMVEVGDAINPGMELAEVETDKIVNVMEATQSGVLQRKVAEESDVLPVGALLGVVGDGSATDADIDEFIAAFGTEVSTAEECGEGPAAAEAPAGIFEITMPKWGLTMEEGTLVKWMVEVGATVEPGLELAEVETDKIVNVLENLHPGVLRRVVAEEGDVLPVGALLGIIAASDISDEAIDAFIAGGGSCQPEECSCSGAAEEANAEPAAPAEAPAEETVPVAGMRAAIAKTVSASWSNIPHYMVTIAIDMQKADALSRKIKESGTKVSINDMIIKASAAALQEFPLMKATFADKNIIMHRDANIAVAIGLDEGVVMPVVKNCQTLSLQEIGAKSRELVALAKEGKLGKEEMAGGTFAISNMGMLGVESFVAIVPPTMSAILAIGIVKDEPVVKDGKIEVARLMHVTISADHRVHDGAYAAKFLGKLKEILEQPESLQA